MSNRQRLNFLTEREVVIMQYTLRKCAYDDFELLFELKKLCMKWYIEKIYDWDDEVQKTKTRNEINRNINDMKIIEVNGRGIGVTTFSKADEYYRVGLIMIHPDYQNKGIGASIISDYIETAKADGKRIIIKTYIKNPARRLYEKLGFAPYETDATHVHLEMDFSK